MTEMKGGGERGETARDEGGEGGDKEEGGEGETERDEGGDRGGGGER